MHRVVLACIVLALMAQIACADASFGIGDRVWTTSDINLKIRDAPGLSSNKLDSVIKGTIGTIIEGPANKDNYNWWKINYDIGTAGWSAENYLAPAPSELQPPSDFSTWAEETIKWGEKRENWDDWNGLCMRFVVDAFAQVDGKPAGYNADGWAKRLYRFNQEPGGWKNAPKGAMIFFDNDNEPVNGKLNTHGHVGIYLVDGKLLHAYGTVQETTIDEAIAKASVGRYLGWSYPPDAWRPNNAGESQPTQTAQPSLEPTASVEAQPAIADEQAKGIDVSDHQGNIDWSQVVGAGYKFAFVKATECEGFTGDPKARQQNFEANMNGASSAGVFAGAYHFARPDLGNSATDEARWFVNVAGDYIKPGYLRPVLDIEKGAKTGEDLSKWIIDWMETVESETGVEPMIYTSASFAAENNLDASLAKYDLWVAHWTYDIGRSPNTGMWDGWDFWQYSNKGSVPGITGDVDLDLFSGGESDLSKFVIAAPAKVVTSEVVQSTENSSKAPSENWNKTFGGQNEDYSVSVQQTSDGGYILIGRTGSFGAGYDDAWLLKIDSQGNELWNKTFGGSGYDYGQSVQQTSDGGYILIGRTGSFGADFYDIWLIKTDSKGNELWNKTFGGSGDEWGNSVKQTIDGGYIIIGNTKYSALLIKTDSSGNIIWEKTLGSLGVAEGYSAQQTADGDYILAGAASNLDIRLLKVDSQGNEAWNRTFAGSAHTIGHLVQQTSDGGYIIIGDTDDSAWLIKIDILGNMQWDRTFGLNYGQSVQQTSDGGYIIAGYTKSFSAGSYDAWLLKTDSEGNEIWNRTFGGASWDGVHSVQQTSDGGYILAGSTESFGAGKNDVWLIKVAPG
ncbi:MAG: GH25 family lysozyme [Methanotrichaceae archaeon]